MFQKFMKMMNKKNKGFTLVELMIVVVIIGILVAIAIPIYNNVTANAEAKSFQANHRIAAGAVQSFMASHDAALPLAAETFTNEIDGGIASLQDHPTGATYTWDGSALTSVFDGTTLTYTP